MHDRTAFLADIIIPLQKIPFHSPIIIVNLIFWLEQRKTLLYAPQSPALHNQLKSGHDSHQLLSHHTHFLTGVVTVNVYLMANGKKFSLDEILRRSILIVHIIGIRPGKHSLFYQ